MKTLKSFPILLIVSSLISCGVLFNNGPEKIYPKNISIPGYGKLTYTKTLFDGKDIKDTVINGNIIWSLDYFVGKIYRHDAQINKTSTFDIEKKNSKTNESVYNMCLWTLIEQNDDICVLVKNNNDKKNYIAKINKNSLSLSFIKMPDVFDTLSFWDGYLYDNMVYFRMMGDDDMMFLYKTSDFAEYTPITDDEFWSTPSDKKYTDLSGRQYDIIDHSTSKTETYLSVSADNGTTWFEGDMGTNYANRVLVIDDTVYVSCHKYYEVIGWIPTGSTGGGLHIFQWQYE